MPPVLPQNLYESIKNEPFKIPEDDGNDLTHTFFNPDREGWLLKLGAWRAAGGTRCGPLRPDPAGARAPGMAFVRRRPLGGWLHPEPTAAAETRTPSAGGRPVACTAQETRSRPGSPGGSPCPQQAPPRAPCVGVADV